MTRSIRRSFVDVAVDVVAVVAVVLVNEDFIAEPAHHLSRLVSCSLIASHAPIQSGNLQQKKISN